VLFLGIVLALSLASEALAQTPIEGWDEAKFGMTPEELRKAYREEEEYYQDVYVHYQQKKLEKLPWGQRQLVKIIPGSNEGFWNEKKEYWSRKNGGLGYPHTLSNSWLRILEDDATVWPVVFTFVDNKLFNVRIRLGGGRIEVSSWEGVYKGEVEARRELNLKLSKLKKALTNKYGDPLKKKEIEEESEKEVLSPPALFKGSPRASEPIPMVIRRESLTWVDAKGNMLKLESYFEEFRYEERSYNLFSHCEINYFDKELTELWEKKQDQWRKEVAQWEKKGKKLREKGVESF